MSKISEIQFDWPVGSADPWDAFCRHVRSEFARGKVTPHTHPCMVTATFTMRATGEQYHTDAPGVSSLADNLLGALSKAGMIDEMSVVQLSIGKVRPGPNAVKVTPGVRVSVMVLGP